MLAGRNVSKEERGIESGGSRTLYFSYSGKIVPAISTANRRLNDRLFLPEKSDILQFCLLSSD